MAPLNHNYFSVEYTSALISICILINAINNELLTALIRLNIAAAATTILLLSIDNGSPDLKRRRTTAAAAAATFLLGRLIFLQTATN